MNNTTSRKKQKNNRSKHTTAKPNISTPLGSVNGKPNTRPSARPNVRAAAKPRKTMDVKLLVKAAVEPDVAEFRSDETFADIALSPILQANLRKKGYARPTDIQIKSIYHLLEGKDVLGIAQTGTGKTGAFFIPLIHNMMELDGNHKVLVMVPTRELAQQVSEEFTSLTIGTGLRQICLIGGTNIDRDISKLRLKYDMIVATPGRLIDLASRGYLQLGQYPVLVLDEFDRMLDMGFAPDVFRIIDKMTSRSQTLLFSATVDKTQKRMIDSLLKNPVEVRVSSGATTGDHIEQNVVRVGSNEDKYEVLLGMLSNKEFEKVLLFAETKRGVERMNKMLRKSGVEADRIHGDRSQNSRQNALDKFKESKIQVLVATDVAARGIDVSDVSHVINYQVPQTYDSYLHRIGRTGRAGKQGKAYTFVD